MQFYGEGRVTRLFFRRLALQRLAALGCLAGLAACSPHYDWRVVQSSEGAYSITYPAKPSSDAREVHLSTGVLPMHMQAARVDQALFAVGVIKLPSADVALRTRVMADLQKGLLANLGAAQSQVQTVQIRVASQSPPFVTGTGVYAQGHGVDGKEQRFVDARFVAYGDRVYQVVVLGEKAPPQEQIEQFFDSFTLE